MNVSTPRTPLRVSVAQAYGTPAKPEWNVATAVRLARQADTDVVVFPELFLTGYHPPTWRSDSEAVSLPVTAEGVVTDPRLDPLRAAVRDGASAPMLLGAAVRVGGRSHIAMLLVNRDGEVRDVYHKRRLCGEDERAAFEPGERDTTMSLRDWRIGLGICYDATFPEHARAAAVAGCQLYLTGGAFVSGGEHRRDLYHAARALDNTCFVAFSDMTGGSDPWSFSGGSAIYDPQGRAMCAVPAGDTGIVTATLDPETLRRTRAEHTMLRDLPEPVAERDVVELS